MTDLLYQTDSYLRDFEATVVRVEGADVFLDRTAFYPTGGGQPNDLGRLADVIVLDVKKDGADVRHVTSGATPDVGSSVACSIDWDRRYQLMRTHSALHVLCGVVFRDFGAQVTGSNMKPLEGRIDFELETTSGDFGELIEEAVNREIAAARPITVRILPREEAFAIPDLIRTKVNLLPEGISQIRIVDINGLDVQADGGTHVHNTQEIGRIRVVGHESKGRMNKRLRIAIE